MKVKQYNDFSNVKVLYGQFCIKNKSEKNFGQKILLSSIWSPPGQTLVVPRAFSFLILIVQTVKIFDPSNYFAVVQVYPNEPQCSG